MPRSLSLPIVLLRPGTKTITDYGETTRGPGTRIEVYGSRETEKGGQDRLVDNIEGGDYTVVWRVRLEGLDDIDPYWKLEDENGDTYDIVEVQPTADRRWWEITARRSILEGA